MYLAVFWRWNYGVLLTRHCYLPPFCYVYWCEASWDFMFACGSHYFFSSVPIISHFIFTINLVSRLFTLYTFFVTDGKRAPTAIGRGSSPRSRTGCDIFNFWQLRGLLRGIGQELPSRLCFNLMQSRGLLLRKGVHLIIADWFQSYAVTWTVLRWVDSWCWCIFNLIQSF